MHFSRCVNQGLCLKSELIFIVDTDSLSYSVHLSLRWTVVLLSVALIVLAAVLVELAILRLSVGSGGPWSASRFAGSFQRLSHRISDCACGPKIHRPRTVESQLSRGGSNCAVVRFEALPLGLAGSPPPTRTSEDYTSAPAVLSRTTVSRPRSSVSLQMSGITT